jgi:uncharacterized protein YuzE
VILEFDLEANAAYVTLGDRPIAPGQAASQSDLIPTPSGLGNVILDFDADGRLIGVEVLSARELLDPALLE